MSRRHTTLATRTATGRVAVNDPFDVYLIEEREGIFTIYVHDAGVRSWKGHTHTPYSIFHYYIAMDVRYIFIKHMNDEHEWLAWPEHDTY